MTRRRTKLIPAALDFVAKKAGYNLSPETEEMITDAAREGYEKYSG